MFAEVIPAVCEPPADTVDHDDVPIDTGEDLSVVVLSPNWPPRLYPHAYKVFAVVIPIVNNLPALTIDQEPTPIDAVNGVILDDTVAVPVLVIVNALILLSTMVAESQVNIDVPEVIVPNGIVLTVKLLL